MNKAPEIAFDDAQQVVVEHGAGALLALGGPGTGKTRVLEERFVALGNNGVTPDRILLLVPNRTQKMALQDRLTRRLLGSRDALVEVPVYTWHGFAYHLVSRHYVKLGYSEPPVLLTSPEQWGAIREALWEEARTNQANWPDHKHLLENRGFVDEVVDFFIRVGQRAMDPPELEPLARVRPAWAELIEFYKRHHAQLRDRNRVDYPTLLRDAVELLANFDGVRESLHGRFRHILVDDGQELALIQQRLLHFLTAFTTTGDKQRSLVIAGDPDSAIETFRGAEPEWIDDFGKEFGDHQSVALTTSYRLGPEVGEPALRMIGRNNPRDHRPQKFAGESTLEVRRYGNLAAEVEAIARDIRMAHLNDKIRYEDMAILLTSPRSMLPPLERALAALEVPFSVSAPDRPLGREPIVRAFLDLDALARTDEPDAEELGHLLRSRLIGLDDATVRELERVARIASKPLMEVIEDPAGLEDQPGAVERLAEFVRLRDIVRASTEIPADQAFYAVWKDSLLQRELEEGARSGLDHPAHRDLDALVAFSRALSRFVERRGAPIREKATFEDYREAIERADFGSDPWLPPERSGGGVNVLSFHGAKGKEWKLVAVAGVVEGAIPKGRRATGLFDPYYLDETDPVARNKKNEMEDRRVFYVSITRATHRCIVTTSPGPTRRGEPSRFIEELTGAVPDFEDHADLPPLTFSEAAARYRKTLADTSAPAAERLAALTAITEICKLDPNCTSAQPSEWWWRWDWSEGAMPLRVQQQQTEQEDVPLEKLRTSYSRIGTYDNCGLQYLLSVALGLDPETSHSMAFGSVIHRIFEEIEKGVFTPNDWDAVWKRYEDLFEKIEGQFPNKAVARQYRRDGQKMIMRYGTYLKPGTAVGAEIEFKVDLDGHRIKGRIDRVDKRGNKIVISDYKTSRHPVQFEEARESLQLAIYYLAAQENEELKALGEPGLMQLIYPGAQMSRGEVATRSQTPEQAIEALKRLPGLMEGVLAEDFRPNPEANCMWCKFKPLCPLWSEGKELPA